MRQNNVHSKYFQIEQFIPSPQVILYDINPRKLDKGQPH